MIENVCEMKRRSLVNTGDISPEIAIGECIQTKEERKSERDGFSTSLGKERLKDQTHADEFEIGERVT